MAVETDTWRGIAEIVAGCECGWSSRAKNAMGNAARHARATGHVVNVLQQLSVTYAPRGMSRAEMKGRLAAAFNAQDEAD